MKVHKHISLLFAPVLLLLLIAMQGCSWTYDFNIINSTGKPVTISYKLKSGQGIFSSKPSIYKKQNGEIVADSSKTINYSEQDKIVEFTLDPGEQATIASGINVTLKGTSKNKATGKATAKTDPAYNLEWLKISKENKKTVYTMDNIERELTRNEIGISEIEIK